MASTVRVTERPRRPASQQPRPTLLLKAMRDAQRSTVASVRPFLVRAQNEPPKQQQRNKVGHWWRTDGSLAREGAKAAYVITELVCRERWNYVIILVWQTARMTLCLVGLLE